MVDNNNFALKTNNVYVHYGNKMAINNVALDFPKNEVTSLIGPSGCGKSTFLRCLNRMNDVIDSCKVEGSFIMNNTIDIYSDDLPIENLREKIGMVFKSPTHSQKVYTKMLLMVPKSME